MSLPSDRLPKYRHYKPKNLAVVRIAGKDVYLGPYDSPASHEKYRRVVAEWLASGRGVVPESTEPGPAGLLVAELVADYAVFATQHYRKNGEPTSELGLVQASIKVLRELYGSVPAAEFGPKKFKVVRQTFVDSGLCRNEVNKRAGRVVRCFRWGVENELIPATVVHSLESVPGLRKGRCEARESEPVRPVSDPDIEAVRPHVGRRIWAMIQLQRLTGARPGEIVSLRTGDIERSGPVWCYRPRDHKTAHRGLGRQIPIGPRAQEILAPWLRADPDAYLFQPCEATAERKAELRSRRKTRVQPSQRDRRKARPKKAPGDHYTVDSYRRAIANGCEKAGIAPWHPHQIRHTRATEIRREAGLDVARAALGHSSPAVTEHYADLDFVKAAEFAAKMG